MKPRDSFDARSLALRGVFVFLLLMAVSFVIYGGASGWGSHTTEKEPYSGRDLVIIFSGAAFGLCAIGAAGLGVVYAVLGRRARAGTYSPPVRSPRPAPSAWWWRWRSRPIGLESTLPPAAAALRLGTGLEQASWPSRAHASDRDGRVVKGNVSGGDIRLYVQRPTRRNALTPILRGRFVANESGGSEFVGVIGWHPLAVAFYLFCVGLLTTALVAALAGAVGNVVLAHWHSAGFSARFAAGCLIFLASLLAVMAYGDRFGRRDEAYLVEWTKARLSEG